MEHIELKLDKLQEDVVEIKETLARNTTSLEMHMERTKLAEDRIEMLHENDSQLKERVDAHINQVKGAFLAITTICALIFALWQMGILGRLL